LEELKLVLTVVFELECEELDVIVSTKTYEESREDVNDLRLVGSMSSYHGNDTCLSYHFF
jgi:hypothetical protein